MTGEQPSCCSCRTQLGAMPPPAPPVPPHDAASSWRSATVEAMRPRVAVGIHLAGPAACIAAIAGQQHQRTIFYNSNNRNNFAACAYSIIIRILTTITYPGRIWPDLLDCKTYPWVGFCNS